jgi:hypothetical protein
MMITESLFEPVASQALVDRYLMLTRCTLPYMAQDPHRKWPVKHDHCFQRIVLDNVCGGAWHTFINKPAYRHLNHQQATEAVTLCHKIISGDVDLRVLNNLSLAWREALKSSQKRYA